MDFIRYIENSNEIDRILNRDFTSIIRPVYIEVGEDNICLPVYYKDYCHRINEFKIKDDDIYIFSYPKTGSTWTQEMVWLIMNNLDYETARKIPIYQRSRFLEWICACLYDIKKLFKNTTADELWENVVNSPPPRIIKSHLPWSLLPEELRKGIKTPKIIVPLRNPEDVCISFFYYSQTSDAYKGTLEDFCRLFLAGRVNYGPFWKQVLSYWNERHRPNIRFLYYKDMVDNLEESIKNVASFLERPITEEEVINLSKHLSFESMKNNPAVNGKNMSQNFIDLGLCVADNDFMRSGKVGEHKLKLSAELLKAFKSWKEKNTKDIDLVL